MTMREENPGYSASGESKYSRRASSGAKAQSDVSPRERAYWSKLDMMADHQAQQVARLERRVAEAPEDKRGPIIVRLQKTRHFLTRLRAEQQSLVGRDKAMS